VAKRGGFGSLTGLRKKEALTGYLFLVPNLIGFLTFNVVPIGAAILLAFSEWDLASTPKFTGLGNFAIMVQDDLFWKTLGNTFYYAFVAVPTGVLAAFFLALLINRKMRGVLAFRVVYFLPHVTLSVAAALIWAWIYHPDFGLINYLLGMIGIQGPSWLFDSRWAMPAVIIMSNWRGIGYAMLVFLAGLQGIPYELYEAATIDGASGWQQLLHVTVPMLSPTTFFILTTSLIGGFQAFDQFYVMTQGGPAFSTTPIVLYTYNNAFQYFKMGYAASMAAVLFLCIFVITRVQWRLARTWVYGFVE
jgi:multiple sugar transport system permease protein